jgi:8-oxo-dGTP pyrophosphatase MutT (NUDIX family)
MGYLSHIRACNAHDLSGFIPFEVAGQRLGWLRPALARRLPEADPAFRVSPGAVTLAPELRDFEARSKVMQIAAAFLVEEGLAPPLRGEFYPVLPRWGADPVMRVDRAVVSCFGIAAYGLHVNGFVRGPDGGIDMWVGRRATDRGVAPGQYDNMVAGGQPIGLSLAENLEKEAREEAGVPPALAARAVPVGAVRYLMETEAGLKPDTLFLYDLELDRDFVPVNTDGEVAEFQLWPLDRVARSVRDTGDWKFNVNLVVIDFLVRHGHLRPEDPDYLDIVAGLRR